MRVNLRELQEYSRWRQEINAADIEDIIWVLDGEEVNVPSISIEEWKFLGLNNTDFPFNEGLITR